MRLEKEERAKKNSFFCTLRIKRVQKGVEIFVRSKEVEDFFRTDDLTFHQWGGLRGYLAPSGFSLPDSRFDAWGEDFLVTEDLEINLSFLRAVGLSEGVRFVMRGVFSLDQIRWFAERARETLKVFYLQFLKPVEAEVTVSTAEHGEKNET